MQRRLGSTTAWRSVQFVPAIILFPGRAETIPRGVCGENRRFIPLEIG